VNRLLARFLGIKTDRDITREVLAEPTVRQALKTELRGKRILRELQALETRHGEQVADLIDAYRKDKP
jgi:hypothetical protein